MERVHRDQDPLEIRTKQIAQELAQAHARGHRDHVLALAHHDSPADQELQHLLDCRLERPAGLEDEFVLEEARQLPRAVEHRRPRRPLAAVAAHRQRDDRRGDEEMEDGVLVVVERHPPLFDHRVEALPAGFLHLDVPVGAQPEQRALDEARLAQACRRKSRSPAPHLPRGRARAGVERRLVQELRAREDLVLGHAAPVVAEEDGGDEPDRRQRRRAVDAGRDPQPQGADESAALLLGMVLRVHAALREQLCQRDRLAHPDGDAAQPGAQHLGGGEERLRVLLLLLAAEKLLLVAARLGDLLVRDGDRREHHVRADAGEPRLHLQREHPQLGREQLAGARTASLDEELLREAVAQEALHVRLHHRRIHAVALEAAPDEEGAPHAEEAPHRPEVQVVPGGDVRRLKAEVVADDREHHVIEVALVRRAQDERRARARLRQPLHPRRVDVHAVVDAAEHPPDDALQHVDRQRVVAGGDLTQVLARLAIERIVRPAALAGQLGQRAPELQVVERLIDDPLRRLERGPGDHPGLARQVLVERAAHLPGDAARVRLRLLRHHRGEIDRLAHLEHCLLAVQHEGQEAAQRAGLVRVAEEEVAHPAPQLLGTPPPDQRDGHQLDAPARLLALEGGEARERIGEHRHRAGQRPGHAQEDERGLALPHRLDHLRGGLVLRRGGWTHLLASQVPAREGGEDPVAQPGRGARDGKAQPPEAPVEEEEMEQGGGAQDVDGRPPPAHGAERLGRLLGKRDRAKHPGQQPARERPVVPGARRRVRGAQREGGARLGHGAAVYQRADLSIRSRQRSIAWRSRAFRRARPARRPPSGDFRPGRRRAGPAAAPRLA